MPSPSGLRALLLAGVLLGSAGAGAQAPPPGSGAPEVPDLATAERAFAATMARRDFAGFAAHIADDAVFLNGGRPLRGKAAILDHWRRFFVAPAAPFTWAPTLAEVSGDGRLGATEGLVRGPDGVAIARFSSTWRRGADGGWQVVFDNGADLCAAPPPGPTQPPGALP